MMDEILFWVLTGSVVTLAGLHFLDQWLTSLDDIDMPYEGEKRRYD